MAISMGQFTVTSAATTPIFTVPPGLSSTTFWLTSGTAFTGLSTLASTVNGASVPTTPVTFECFPGSAGHQVFGVSPNTGVISYVIASGA
jgi:hypothetical protein